MISRSLVAGLAFLCCLCLEGLSLGQEPKPEARREQGKGPNSADLERRVAELEKQLHVLTREVEALLKQIQPPTARLTLNNPTVKLLSLRKADAGEVAKTLQQLLQGDEVKTLSIATHPSTNSIIIRGNPEALGVLEAIILRLDEEAARRKGAKGQGKP